MQLLSAAKQTVHDLTGTLRQRHLLHGDFSNKNILASQDAFVVIDPIPTIGDRCTDVANFASAQPAAKIFPTVAAVSQALDIDPSHTARWTAVLVVLQDCQAWRDDQAELDALITSGRFQTLLA